MSDVNSKFSYEEDHLLQIVLTEDYVAVFGVYVDDEPIGRSKWYRQIVPLHMIALANEWSVHMEQRPGDIPNETGRSGPYSVVVGMYEGECGYEVCCACNNCFGIMRKGGHATDADYLRTFNKFPDALEVPRPDTETITDDKA